MIGKKLVARFTDESALLKAITRLKDKKIKIIDVYGPYATHDILKKITKESRLPYLGVIYGVLSLLAMFSFMYYTTVIDYPLVYGGKPYFSFPPMVVLMFLVCILLTTILTSLTFHGRTMIFPGKPANIMGPSVTDDSFFLVLEQDQYPQDLRGWLQDDGAEEITEKEI